MFEQGKVIKATEKEATVRLARSSACGNCGMCGMTDEQKHIDVDLPNTLLAKTGDTVKISIDEGASLKAGLIVYLIPLAVALIAMFTALLFSAPDWVIVIAFVGGLGIGFFVVRLIDVKFAKKMNMVPKMVEIVTITDHQDQDNNQIKENNNERS